MSVINVDNMNFDNSYADLSIAVNAAQDNDEIRLFKDIMITDPISFNNKKLIINGNHHKIIVEPQKDSETGYALVLYSNALKLMDLDVTLEGNDIFILQIANIKNKLVLDNVSINHRNQPTGADMIPAVSRAYSTQVKGDPYANPLQTTELHNCKLDYVRMIANQLIIKSTSIYGTDYQSSLIGNQIDINGSLINSTYISSIRTDTSINLNNIASIGNLTVSGNMDLNGFKLLVPNKPFKDARYALTITSKRHNKIEHEFEQKSNNAVSNLDLSDQSHQGMAAWFKVENADLTFNNTVIPETNGAPNGVENSSIHFNNTKNLSQWEQFNPSDQPDADEDEPAPTNEDQGSIPDDQPVEPADVDNDQPIDPNDAIYKLNQLVGLANVKSQVKSFVDFAKTNLRRQKYGLKANSISMNMLFEGNPGTGKTVVARLVGEAMFQNGILKGKRQDDGTYVSNFQEVQVQDLVDSSIGGTPIKTQDAVKKALDGVLFIDEAYSLAPVAKGSNGDIFKNEAVNTLIAEMENNRDRLVVIMAGYTQEMENFMEEGNPGLSSRFTNKIIFPDYSPDELVQILKLDFKNNEYTCDAESIKLLDDRIREVYPYKGAKGNARFIRNVFDDLIKQQSMRLAPLNDDQLTTDDMRAITMADVQKTIEHSQHLQIDEADKPVEHHQQSSSDHQVHNKPASSSDPRNAIIQKSKLHSLQSLYKLHQIMDDLDADYDTRTIATLKILSFKNDLKNQLSAFDADTVKQAELLLPFFDAFDADVDYAQLNQQLESLNGEQ